MGLQGRRSRPARGAKHVEEEIRQDDLKRLDLPISGMSCASCAANVERALKHVEGVRAANVNLATSQATVMFDPRQVDPGRLARAVRDAGYEVPGPAGAPERRGGEAPLAVEEYRKLKNSVIWGGALALVVFLGGMRHWFPWVPGVLQNSYVLWALATPIQFVLGFRFYKGAWAALRHRSADMNTLVAVGTTAAYVFSGAVTVAPGLLRSAGSHPSLFRHFGRYHRPHPVRPDARSPGQGPDIGRHPQAHGPPSPDGAHPRRGGRAGGHHRGGPSSATSSSCGRARRSPSTAWSSRGFRRGRVHDHRREPARR